MRMRCNKEPIVTNCDGHDCDNMFENGKFGMGKFNASSFGYPVLRGLPVTMTWRTKCQNITETNVKLVINKAKMLILCYQEYSQFLSSTVIHALEIKDLCKYRRPNHHNNTITNCIEYRL